MHTTRTMNTRQGFTLVELLVVITIIAILAALLLGGVLPFLNQGPIVTARSEISNLEGAMAQFKQDFGVDYIPSDIVLREDQYDTSLATHRKAVGYLTRLFGKNAFKTSGSPGILLVNIDWNSNGIQAGEVRLTGEQCLVFFLGGIPSSTGGNQTLGFSKDPINPGAVGGPRYGPYFQFKKARLVDGGSGYFAYLDPYKRPANLPAAQQFTRYGFFAANKGGTYEANSTTSFYYVDGAGAPVNPNGYQIICAGQDGLFGSIPGTPGSWTSAGTAVVNGKDDQANFASGLLGAAN